MRVYSRASAAPAIDVHERDRPHLARSAMHTDRDATAVREDVRIEARPDRWVNPTALDAPPPNSGMVQKWIAGGSGASDNKDASHWMKKMREGWRPRDPSSVSEAQRRLYTTAKTSDGTAVIQVAGLILCEMPRQVAWQRKNAVSDSVQHQLKSVPESMQELSKREGGLGPVQVTSDDNVMRGRKPATMVD